MDIYKAALDNSVVGMLISDPQGKVVYVNEHYEHITGIKKQDILNKNLRELVEKKLINRAISLEVIEHRVSVSVIHSYVSGKSAMTTAVPIFDENGEILAVINNTQNVTDLLRLEEKLRSKTEETEWYSRQITGFRHILNEPHNFICESKVMERVFALANKVAPYDSTVLITGESGTGKEVLARYIHSKSQRSDKAFIAVNCGAIPKELMESELFGYEKGAFTGARAEGKVGFFELANGGTLLLDEIGELPKALQTKLLRALQEREIMRVGGTKPIKINVRILASTNRDLSREVSDGNFREDLYFRLNVVPLHISPLRDRSEDIPLMIDFFLEKLNRKYKTTKSITPEAKESLCGYSFPGNVRELQNIIEYLYIMSIDTITMETIPGKVLSNVMLNTLDNPTFTQKRNLPELVELYEKTVIEDTIRKYHTLETAARAMGIHPSTLSRKMNKYSLRFEK